MAVLVPRRVRTDRWSTSHFVAVVALPPRAACTNPNASILRTSGVGLRSVSKANTLLVS